MSVEKIQLLHDDYIRLTERFKALWTFHQFVRGVHKTFFSSDPGQPIDFTDLYDQMKTIASHINTGSPEAVAPLLRDLNSRLDGVARQLRDADRKFSPSLLRRFFERVRPQDEKIAFYLLRFYFSQADIDDDVIDKVDFLATVAATGRADPDASATKPRSQIKKFFESLTASSVWPRMDTAMTPAIVRAFDELATDVASAREFEELLNQRLLENVRTMKRRVASGLSNPEILTAVAWCNLTSRSVFHRLYEKEERRLDEATGRITDLEREWTHDGDEGPPPEFRRFRDSRIRFDQQTKERNVRAQQVVELKAAIGDVLTKFDAPGLEAEDIEAAVSFYGPDAVWDASPWGMGVFEGQAALRGFFEDWSSSYSGLEWTAEEIRDLGNGVTFAVILQKGRVVGSTSSVQLRYAAVAEWRDGLIVRNTSYTDIDQARAGAERLAAGR